MQWISSYLYAATPANPPCRPGPGRNIPDIEALVNAKLKLSSPRVVTCLQQMSLLADIQKIKSSLRPVTRPPPPCTFEPTHPVLRELLLKTARIQ